MAMGAKEVVARLKSGAKVGAMVGGGFVFAKYGADVLKSSSVGVASFAAKSKWHEAGVRLGVGAALSIGLGFLLGRRNTAAVAKFTAYAMGGVALAAAEPVVSDAVHSATETVKAWFNNTGTAAAALAAAATTATATPALNPNLAALRQLRAAGYGSGPRDVYRAGGGFPDVVSLARVKAL